MEQEDLTRHIIGPATRGKTKYQLREVVPRYFIKDLALLLQEIYEINGSVTATEYCTITAVTDAELSANRNKN